MHMSVWLIRIIRLIRVKDARMYIAEHDRPHQKGRLTRSRRNEGKPTAMDIPPQT